MAVGVIPAQDHDALRPWLPDCLPQQVRDHLDGLRYVMVDEVVGDLVTLTVTAWPDADGHGKIRFPRSEESATGTGHLLVHARELHDLLYQGWLRRGPRPGDVFAAEVAADVEDRLQRGEDVAMDEHLRLATVLPGVVCDITAEARNVAKLAFYAGMAGVQPMEQAEAQRQVPTGDQVHVARSGTVKRSPWKGPYAVSVPSAGASAGRWELPDQRLQEPSSIVDAIRTNSTALFYFLLNVGDGDTQLLLLPASAETGQRRVVVVDAATTRKLPALLEQLATAGLVPSADSGEEVCALVVATHPHDDHIEGLAELLAAYGSAGVADFWEPGYYAPSGSFAEMMAVIEEQRIRHGEPTAGTTQYLDGVKITVLAPSVHLRTAYDSYGVDCNDASIVMKVEFPAVRIAVQRHEDGTESRTDLRLPKPWSLILGADAQTRSWSHVTAEFPQLHRGHNAALYRGLSEARGRDYLAAEVLKVSHHASKHGINIELIERMKPQVTLISSVGGGGRYGFPHALATQAIAEALAPTSRSGVTPPHDADLGIHYTGGCSADGTPLGSIALMVPPKRGARLVMWRFGDNPRDKVDLTSGRVLHPIRSPRRPATTEQAETEDR
jgi:hypothetical protein